MEVEKELTWRGGGFLVLAMQLSDRRRGCRPEAAVLEPTRQGAPEDGRRKRKV
jgi:hypothetical protein